MAPSKPLAKSLLVLLCIGLTVAPVSYALDLQLANWQYLGTLQNGDQNLVATLAPGSIVEIPDEFRVDDQYGRVDPEQSLFHWLQRAGTYGGWGKDGGPGYYKDSFKGAGDYYYPITVKYAAPGSQNPDAIDQGHSYYMALGNLALKKNLLVVTGAAQIRRSLPAAYAPYQATASGHATEASPACPDGRCAERPRSSELDRLVEYLKPALDSENARTNHNSRRTTDDLRAFANKFQRTCGIPFKSFATELERVAHISGIPATAMLSIITQESSGSCSQVTTESDGGVSVGLFQIHQSNYPPCSAYEYQEMQGASIASLRRDPRCLNNPLINLQEGIREIKQKMTALTAPSTRLAIDRVGTDRYGRRYAQRAVVNESGFDPERLKTADGQWNAEMWRLVASAYNGGEGWVLRAKNDLEEYNQRNGTKLSPYNWEDLRVFYLRRYLNRYSDVPEELFGSRDIGRNERNAEMNLSYAENVEPRDHQDSGQGGATLAERWNAYLSSF